MILLNFHLFYVKKISSSYLFFNKIDVFLIVFYVFYKHIYIYIYDSLSGWAAELVYIELSGWAAESIHGIERLGR